ncbi:hypothetical protein [Paracoccus mutanolyticus]|uniref:hypothetical protein n=1 Tax=Paracoccus mutanolyticus TaxID=1499308 RepID=UPI0011AEAC44|nr:hypothetical protein [Paracoccus mutanolyticus]
MSIGSGGDISFFVDHQHATSISAGTTVAKSAATFVGKNLSLFRWNRTSAATPFAGHRRRQADRRSVDRVNLDTRRR